MFVESSGNCIGVTFEAGDPPELPKKVARALGYCCTEGGTVEVYPEGAMIQLAHNASRDGALMLLDSVAATHDVEGSPTLVEQAHDEILLDDGLPFVISH